MALLALKMEGRGWGVDVVEVPRGGRDIDARTVGHPILVYPQLVFVGSLPRAVAVNGRPIYEQGGGSGLVPYLQVQLVVASRDGKCLWHTKLQLAVERQIILTLGGNADSLFPI